MLKSLRFNFSLLLISVIMCGFNTAFAKNAEDVAAVQKAYYNWCTAIGEAKGDGKKMVKFYASDGVLNPTLSSKVIVDHKGLDEYFSKLTSHKDIKCTPDKLITHMHNETAINSGKYVFSYTDDKDTMVKLPARFSFVYKKEGDEWMIVNHHSSAMPK